MAEKKVTREVQEPKELSFFEKNVKEFLIVILAVVVVIGIITYFVKAKEEKTKSIEYKYSKLLEEFRKKEINIYNWQKELKNQKILEDELKKFEKFADKYSGTAFGKEALFMSAKLYYIKKDYDKAYKLFKKYKNMADNELEEARALFAIGKIYETKAFNGQKELYNDAISMYEKMIKKYKDFKPFYWEALLTMGNCYMAQDKLDKAQECYKKILKEENNKNKDIAFFVEAHRKLDKINKMKKIK